MKDEIWPAIHKVFMAVKDVSNDLSEDEDSFNKDYEVLLELRRELRTLLIQLKKVLSANMIERDVYFVLFPIVVYLDEMVQLKFFNVKERSWALLQQEFFEVENGGVLFYDTLENVLKNEATASIVYEVFTLCLNDGFQGLYSDNPNKIDAYLNMLRNKVTVKTPPVRSDEEEEETFYRVGIAPKWFYWSAALLLVVIYATTVWLLRSDIGGL